MKYNTKKDKRKTRVRSKVRGVSKRPRLSIFRSNKNVYAQIIDDEKGSTLVAVSQKDLKKADREKLKGIEKASKLGEVMAAKAKKKKVLKVVFDRGAYKYHGQVKVFAESARKGGLKF